MKLKRFTPEEDQFIRDNYLTLTLNQMADELDRALGSVAGRMRVLKLKIPDEIKEKRFKESYTRLAESGKMHRFTKGQTPHNKGQKMPDHVYEKCKGTMFKPGQLPHNTKHFGKPYLYTRKKKNGYIERIWFIQVNRKRRSYLTYLCEQNGVDLTGRKPILREGFDHSHAPEIDDILILTNKENMARNTITRYPTELRRLIRTHAKFKKQIENDEK